LTPQRGKYAMYGLVAAVIFAAIYLMILRSRVRELARQAQIAEQAQRKITQGPISTPTDARVKAQLFWASTTTPGALDSSVIELPLSADPVQRSRQLVDALILSSPTPAQRTLPADATLLSFYLLPDGTAFADFADTLSTGTPSGILSEQLAVDSITKTLAASVPQIRRLKILLHGQEADTLAGHLDLTGYFMVNAALPPTQPIPAPPPAIPPTPPPGR
jgi:hypothetical protein